MQAYLNCPVELRGYELLHDDREHARAYLRLSNLSYHCVSELEADVLWTNESNATSKASVHATQLRVPARGAFTLPVSTDQLTGVTGLELTITRVRFEDRASFWSSADHTPTLLPEIPIADGRERNALASVAGSDAICFPFRAKDVWVCVCGKVNRETRKKCMRCRRVREDVLTDFTPARILATLDLGARAQKNSPVLPAFMQPPSHDAPAPDANALLRSKFLRQRALLIRRTITMLVILLLILFTALGVKTLRARRLMRDNSVRPTKIETDADESPAPTV